MNCIILKQNKNYVELKNNYKFTAKTKTSNEPDKGNLYTVILVALSYCFVTCSVSASNFK